MSDLFQEDVPESFIVDVFETMRAAHWHTYQVLTKRADRMSHVVRNLPTGLRELPNVWLGVSVEDRKYGLPRIDLLRATPAAIRFLSIEPLLQDLCPLNLSGIHWVIVGGESGPGARPMEEQWVVDIRKTCVAQKIPFFFKQWGGVQKGKHGRLLRTREYNEFPKQKEARHTLRRLALV